MVASDANSLSQAEQDVRAFLRAGDVQSATTRLLEAYADELTAYLVQRLGDREVAREAYAVFAADVWRGIATLQIEHSARAWAYAVARNAASRTAHRAQQRRRERPLSQAPEAGQLAAGERDSTPPYLRTVNKARIAALRERLTADELELIVLRIDRALDWREIATVLGAGADELDRVAARQRKRFQGVKRKLAGWLHEGEPEDTPP